MTPNPSYKGRLRVVDLDALLAEPPDDRPLFCPDCSQRTTAGWCADCGMDWCDGLADKLRAANPHVYGTVRDCEAKLVEIGQRYYGGDQRPLLREQYKYLHQYWMENR